MVYDRLKLEWFVQLDEPNSADLSNNKCFLQIILEYNFGDEKSSINELIHLLSSFISSQKHSFRELIWLINLFNLFTGTKFQGIISLDFHRIYRLIFFNLN